MEWVDTGIDLVPRWKTCEVSFHAEGSIQQAYIPCVSHSRLFFLSFFRIIPRYSAGIGNISIYRQRQKKEKSGE